MQLEGKNRAVRARQHEIELLALHQRTHIVEPQVVVDSVLRYAVRMSDVTRAKRRRAQRTPGSVHVEPRPPERADDSKKCPGILTENENASSRVRDVRRLDGHELALPHERGWRTRVALPDGPYATIILRRSSRGGQGWRRVRSTGRRPSPPGRHPGHMREAMSARYSARKNATRSAFSCSPRLSAKRLS